MKTIFELADWSKKDQVYKKCEYNRTHVPYAIVDFHIGKLHPQYMVGFRKGKIYFKFDKFNITEPVMLYSSYNVTL